MYKKIGILIVPFGFISTIFFLVLFSFIEEYYFIFCFYSALLYTSILVGVIAYFYLEGQENSKKKSIILGTISLLLLLFLKVWLLVVMTALTLFMLSYIVFEKNERKFIISATISMLFLSGYIIFLLAEKNGHIDCMPTVVISGEETEEEVRSFPNCNTPIMMLDLLNYERTD